MSIEIKGKNATGSWRAVKVNDNGELCVSSGGAAGPSSDTTAANQTAQISEAQSTNTKLDTVISQTADNATSTNQASQITEAQSTNTKLDTLISNGSDAKEAKQDALITEQQSTNTKLDSLITNTSSSDAKESKQDDQITELQIIKDAETVNVDWDYYDISYVTSGNGIGEIETITYFTGVAPAGTQVLELSFTYDASSNITRVERV